MLKANVSSITVKVYCHGREMLEDLTVPFVKMKMLDKIEGFYEEMLSQFNSKPCNIINIKHIRVTLNDLISFMLHGINLPKIN